MLVRTLVDRRLLTHPFYLRWQSGDVSRDELRSYTAQYRHFETAFPGYLRAVADAIGDADARRLVEANLADEVDGPVTHVELLDRFAVALGNVKVTEPTPATAALLATYGELVSAGPEPGLAAIVAYEVQFPEIAAAKGQGLRRDHGMDHAGTAFWDVHSELDVDHAAAGVEALSRIAGSEVGVSQAAGRAASAWWAFLDERQAGDTLSRGV